MDVLESLDLGMLLHWQWLGVRRCRRAGVHREGGRRLKLGLWVEVGLLLLDLGEGLLPGGSVLGGVGCLGEERRGEERRGEEGIIK